MMTTLLKPFLEEALKALTGILVIMLLTVIGMLKKRLVKWLDARTTAAQRELIHRIAAEAFAIAETVYRNTGGPQKLNAALEYMAMRLSRYGIRLDPEDLRAAIEKAVLAYHASVPHSKQAKPSQPA